MNIEKKTSFYTNGNVSAIYYVINENVCHGKETRWDYNGNIKWITNWFKGVKHGQSVGWNNDGTKDYEINYDNGNYQGLYILWDHDKLEYATTHFQNDLHGIEIVFINEKRN